MGKVELSVDVARVLQAVNLGSIGQLKLVCLGYPRLCWISIESLSCGRVEVSGIEVVSHHWHKGGELHPSGA